MSILIISPSDSLNFTRAFQMKLRKLISFSFYFLKYFFSPQINLRWPSLVFSFLLTSPATFFLKPLMFHFPPDFSNYFLFVLLFTKIASLSCSDQTDRETFDVIYLNRFGERWNVLFFFFYFISKWQYFLSYSGDMIFAQIIGYNIDLEKESPRARILNYFYVH